VTAAGAAPAAAGAVILFDLLAARLLFTATEAGVWILGRPLDWECSMRRIGLLCPTCGMTRSMVLAIHGEWTSAWHVAPGGPLVVAGMLILAGALLGLGWLDRAGRNGEALVLRNSILRGSLGYAAVTCAIWMVAWAVRFSMAWPGR
jgi:hypothetical protein